jgi:hypothetical protein
MQSNSRNGKPSGPVPTTLRMRPGEPPPKTEPVRARIIWPALGFPAVISPPARPGESPFKEGDATRTICVLLVSNKRLLSNIEIAQGLRIVPWSQRGKRFIPAGQSGSFRDVDISVRNELGTGPSLFIPRPKDERSDLIAFGGNAGGDNLVLASLAKKVREFYKNEKLEFFHEIRIAERVVSKLPNGQYHLFWNNAVPNENAPSDELDLLLKKHARPTRQKLGALWQKFEKRFMDEYEFEFDTIHEPYKSASGGNRKVRTEILHPVFVRRDLQPTVRVGHLTDIHVNVRADVYEENLKQKPVPGVQYNNWNKAFVATYQHAKQDADIMLLTGDLVDYGRGHFGVAARNTLGDDTMYHVDRNWFLFYFLLASRDAYQRPVYTNLGNHDWRLNPYPPFVPGSPSPATMIHNGQKFSGAQQEAIIDTAHGGGSRKFAASYDPGADAMFRRLGTKAKLALKKLFVNLKTLDVPKFPTETTVESVAWYLLTINPFLDYRFTLPRGHHVLMVDWAEDENVVFDVISQGKRWTPVTPKGFEDATDEGPKAKNCLSELQQTLVKSFAEAKGPAKIIGIHAPPIAPWDDWTDRENARGWKDFNQGGRGWPYYRGRGADGKMIQGHPLFAIKPSKAPAKDATEGMEASYNSFEKWRPEFIRLVADPKHCIRLVLSGHIHRQGMFVVYKASKALGEPIVGELLIKQVLPKDARDVKYPAASHTGIPADNGQMVPATGPLYVNTTSVGPRGHVAPAKGVHVWADPGYAHAELSIDGTIKQVEFRSITPSAVPVVAPPVRAPSRQPVGVP